MELNGKNILITGASSGIGRSIAIECSKQGANVHILGRVKETLITTLEQCTQGNHSLYVTDVNEIDKIENIISDIVVNYGLIDGFVHSAGKQITLPLKSMGMELYQDIFSVNTISAFELTRLISKKKNVSGNGASVVYISSIMGVVGNSALVAYCASKAALIGGARALAIELSSKNIRVNCISPGYIETKMMKEVQNTLSEEEVYTIKKDYPLKLGKPSDISNLCVYLLSHKASWITGQNFIVDGGYTAK